MRPTALPIDSLDLVAFLCAVDQEFGVRISLEEFQTAGSIDALFVIIAARSGTTNKL
jgi:acyl carrier protein